MLSKRTVVFCDFDGTITSEDTFIGTARKFAPIIADDIFTKFHSRKLSIKETVIGVMSGIKSVDYPALLQHAERFEIRPSFSLLTEYLHREHIPLIIISSGYAEIVRRTLSRPSPQGGCFLDYIHQIIAVEVDTSGHTLQPTFVFGNEYEVVAKGDFVKTFDCDTRVIIGDSASDYSMAIVADLPFCRDKLEEYMQFEGRFYIPWNNFGDVVNELDVRLKQKVRKGA